MGNPTQQFATHTEMEFLASILRQPAAMASVYGRVHPFQLYLDSSQKIFAGMVELHEAGKEPTFAILAGHLATEGRLDDIYVNGQQGYGALAEIDHYGDRCGTPLYYVDALLRQFAQRNRMHLVSEIVSKVSRPTGSDAELAEELEHFARTLRQVGCTSSRWPSPITLSMLQAAGNDIEFLVDGMIARGHLTLLSALMKAGKSTWLGFLLKALQDGEQFIGRTTRKCKALVVSEESSGLWIRRRDALGLTDAVSVMCRPMLVKPTMVEWADFIGHVAEHAAKLGSDLVVLDTTSAFAPWKSENDAAEVQGTITPLNRLTQAGHAVLLVHHIGKSDQSEGRAARGSTALAGAVDIILELRRYKADDADDRRRVLKGMGRFDEIPTEIVIELATDGRGYSAEGDRKAMAARELEAAILDTLPTSEPGMDADDVHALMPAADRPALAAVRKALLDGASAGKWATAGLGKKGDPRRFWRAVA